MPAAAIANGARRVSRRTIQPISAIRPTEHARDTLRIAKNPGPATRMTSPLTVVKSGMYASGMKCRLGST
jgi:hypothetical protein